MAIEHEVWRLAASGLLDTYIDSLVAVTNRDARARLWEIGAFRASLLITAYESLAYVPEPYSVEQLAGYVVSPIYNPQEDPEQPPRPANAIGGASLSCDDPGEGFETLVYSWDFTTFTELGPLSEHSTPGAGFYVLVNRHISDSALGLPSLFLEIT